MSDYRQQQECEEQELWIELEFDKKIKFNQQVTEFELKRLWHYSPDTGLFTRLVATARSTKVGKVANCHNGKGYIQIMIAGKIYLAHRLAFLYMTGDFPKQVTDHINGVRDDNRWLNLRDVSMLTNSQNQRNQRKNNSSGQVGVSWNKQLKKWQVRMMVDYKPIYLGVFEHKHEATEHYLQEKHKRHFECLI